MNVLDDTMNSCGLWDEREGIAKRLYGEAQRKVRPGTFWSWDELNERTRKPWREKAYAEMQAAAGVTGAPAPKANLCGYCGQDVIPGSECRTSASASACAMYEQHAATHKIEDAAGVDSVHGWLFTTENVSDAEAAQSVLTGRTLEEIQRDIDGVMRRIDSAAGVPAVHTEQPKEPK